MTTTNPRPGLISRTKLRKQAVFEPILRTGGRFAKLSPALFLIGLTFTIGCHKQSVEQVETEAAVPVEVAEAKVEIFRGVIAATGVVTPAPGAELTIVAPEAARIVSMPKAEGDVVKAGDLLVQFDIPTLASDLAARRAAVSQASARL